MTWPDGKKGWEEAGGTGGQQPVPRRRSEKLGATQKGNLVEFGFEVKAVAEGFRLFIAVLGFWPKWIQQHNQGIPF